MKPASTTFTGRDGHQHTLKFKGDFCVCTCGWKWELKDDENTK